MAFLAACDRLRITLPPDQCEHAGQKFTDVHARTLVIKEPLEKDAEPHHAANEEHNHQRAAALHHLEQPDFFFNRGDGGLREEVGDHEVLVSITKLSYQIKDLASATTVSPLRTVNRHDTTGP